MPDIKTKKHLPLLFIGSVRNADDDTQNGRDKRESTMLNVK